MEDIKILSSDSYLGFVHVITFIFWTIVWPGLKRGIFFKKNMQHDRGWNLSPLFDCLGKSKHFLIGSFIPPGLEDSAQELAYWRGSWTLMGGVWK